MNIGIIGAGAIGLLFAAYLSEENHVRIFVQNDKQKQVLLKQGIQLKMTERVSDHDVTAETTYENLGKCDLIIIAVKQYHLTTVIPQIKAHSNHKPILFLQNGIGHLNYMESLSNPTLLVGVVEHGAQKFGEHSVLHNGIGKTNVALFKGSYETLQEVKSLSSKNFIFSIQDNYEEMLIRKLIKNAIINPLTALLNIPNGELIVNDHFREVMRGVYNEFEKIFPQLNQIVSYEEVEKICRNTGENRSSMLMDFELKRRTEIDAILGVPLEIARERKVETPMISLLYSLVKGKEYKGDSE
ncbi:2-dehydropantoate 2-reductase [Bacillus pakistanensis]|uniref:2-dehydropantoate 2-reductase n=1 Tax=Rossellomorea pakistanensis TaxID=992288 RepID=A0ABS2NG46_9BACI|nr:2-dehydropantoate 2-reductase [Bacillus pakistanensis]MBM7586729.1 2-dehydropantoate 2-reductase [Bacillus pakistanensis]